MSAQAGMAKLRAKDPSGATDIVSKTQSLIEHVVLAMYSDLCSRAILGLYSELLLLVAVPIASDSSPMQTIRMALQFARGDIVEDVYSPCRQPPKRPAYDMADLHPRSTFLGSSHYISLYKPHTIPI